MPLDWSKVGAADQDPLLRPRDIFAALPNRPGPTCDKSRVRYWRGGTTAATTATS